MLFNSRLFVLVFLPLALGGFLALGRRRNAALWWLLGCSLFFYGWWKPPLLALLLGSIGVNYAIAGLARRKTWLVAGLAFNLGLLGWFKYAGMFGVPGIVLPLGISFFTFQQIMFLVDSYKGVVKRPPFLDYACFIAFFPHLISGPIVRPGHILPQLAALKPRQEVQARLTEGAEIFLLGLAKKIVLADELSHFVDPGFAAAARGDAISLIEAWVALLAYALQIYFDFSGYSDMAIGLARMFGISFPLNFHSPYQASDISDFWRRWNITLSMFLRDYLYIPLGGNRDGEGKRIRNLMATMLLGGLWHGAAWRFVLWGGLHGVFLIIHGWCKGLWIPRRASWFITLAAVTLAWVPFRAQSFSAAVEMYRGLFGLNGLAVPAMLAKLIPFGHVVPVLPWLGDARSMSLPQGLLLLAVGWFVALCLPDLHSMGMRQRSVALVTSFVFTMQALFFAPAAIPFLYFQF
ncbi:MAG: MBOAT family protein [Rhodospirillales bacterium]|nr:MBOAT family protein [Rhodospirillales bacterium]